MTWKMTQLIPPSEHIPEDHQVNAITVEHGKKFDDGKPRMDLIPLLATIEVAKVMTKGAEKYGDYNWLGGLRYCRLAAAALRHTFAWLAGENLDPETNLSHLAHAACCILMLLEFVLRGKNELDDRYKEKT